MTAVLTLRTGGVFFMVRIIPDEYLREKGLTQQDVSKMSAEEYDRLSLAYSMSIPDALLPVGETYEIDAIRPTREERLRAYLYQR